MSDTPIITKLPRPIATPLGLGEGTSTSQKQKPLSEFLFKKMPTTVYISRRFAKKMLIIGISEVCRKRLCFPEEEFIIRLAGDMKVKVKNGFFIRLFELYFQVLNPYQDDGNYESVTLMKKWIRNIFEWTENGWIDKVAITIGTGVKHTHFFRALLIL